MIIEIAGIPYQILLVDSKKIHIDWNHAAALVHCPADLPLDLLKYYLIHTKQQLDTKEELSYLDEPIQLFQKTYFIKLLKNQASNSIEKSKNSLIISLKSNKHHEKMLADWTKQYIRSQLLDQIAFWEEKLAILVDEIDLRSLKDAIYRVNKKRNRITFDFKIVNLTVDNVQYYCLKAILELYHLDPQLIFAYFPKDQDEVK